jgi:hypothetical protein
MDIQRFERRAAAVDLTAGQYRRSEHREAGDFNDECMEI